MVLVNEQQCKKVAGVLSEFEIEQEFFNRGFIKINADAETKFRAYFYVVAICHQTYLLANPEQNLFGWDYLEHVFYKLLKGKSAFFDPGFMISKSNNEIEAFIRPLFSTDGDPANCTLDSLKERIGFLKEIDMQLNENFRGSILNFIDLTGEYLYNSGNGFYELLSKFESFSDPFKKKISFLVKLLEDAKLIKVKDSENYIPIMDYHMQRVLMRLGCVKIQDEDLYNDLVNRNELETDDVVREACIRAIKIIAEKSGHSIASMNDFFWPHGRSCCNEKPMCISGKCEKNPCSLSLAIDIEPEHKICIFDDICLGRESEYYRNLWQPVVKTHFY